MSKKEYAILHYLLAKLKYDLAEMSIKATSLHNIFEKQMSEIDDICKICIIDGEKDIRTYNIK